MTKDAGENNRITLEKDFVSLKHTGFFVKSKFNNQNQNLMKKFKFRFDLKSYPDEHYPVLQVTLDVWPTGKIVVAALTVGFLKWAAVVSLERKL